MLSAERMYAKEALGSESEYAVPNRVNFGVLTGGGLMADPLGTRLLAFGASSRTTTLGSIISLNSYEIKGETV